jgi:hypothetical protein
MKIGFMGEKRLAMDQKRPVWIKKVTYGRKEQNLLGKHYSRSQILKQIASGSPIG